MSEKSIAVVGLGAMGGAMAATLARAGWSVVGIDPTPAARDAAAARGASTTSDDLAAARGVRYALLSLPSARQVEQVVPALLDAADLVAIVDTTTSEPRTSAAMGVLTRDRGVAFVDAPVSGGRAGAEAGTLAAFVGGDDRSLDAARPVLADLTGGTWRHLGPWGAGNLVKLLNNMLASVNLTAVAEALDVAAAYGLDLTATADALSNATGASRVSSHMFPTWVLPGTFDSGFTTGLMARDVALCLDVARELDADPAVFATTAERWQHALDTLGPGSDFTRATTTFTTATDALTPEADR